MAQVPPLPNPSPGRASDSTLHPEADPESNISLSHLTNLLGQHGAGQAAADLAVDILLNKIVAQACLATNATGAAIALARGSEFVCRATTGKNAPDLGSCLNTTSGLSGACIQSREVQLCENTDTDPRVDADACRALGVQSLLIVPLLKGDDLVGIFEIFAPLPYAFGDRDVQTLLALSRRIIETTTVPPVPSEPAISPVIASDTALIPQQAVPVSPPGIPEVQGTTPPPQFSLIHNRRPARDYWTTFLTVMVVGLALLLGWMLGRVGWQKLTGVGGERLPVSTSLKPEAQAARQNMASQATTPIDQPAAPSQPASSAGPAPQTKPIAPSTGGLAVYEGGKLVFQMKPMPATQHGVELAARKSTADAAQSMTKISPEAADARLLRRVEPQYPQQARREHIQGAVVLVALVKKDGSVQELRALSGDPQLVVAAADAVRQWRFKPYAPEGQPLDFETQVTVNFTLP